MSGARMIHLRGDHILLDTDEVSTDLNGFRKDLLAGRVGLARVRLESDFLEGLRNPPTDEYDDWVAAKRVQLRSDLRNRAAARWSELEGSGRWGEAIEAAEVLHFLDPTDEAALRRLMFAQGMGGRPREAEANFLNYCERRNSLSSEAKWVPSAETRELLNRLRTLTTEPEPDVRAPLRVLHRPPLIGRARELSHLVRFLHHVPERELNLALVSGEAGMGKTRLIQEAILSATLQGALVLRGRAAELQRDIPLNPILEAFATNPVGDALARLEEPWKTVLLGLMPGLHRELEPIPEPPFIRPKEIPRRLFEAIRQLLAELTVQQAVVLVLDDFHWADETSIAILDFLRRRWDHGRLLVILACRPEVTVARPRVARFLQEIDGSAAAVTIELEELSSDAADELVEVVAGRPVPPEDLEEIRTSGGPNPFHLIELTAEYLEGRLTRRPDLDGLRPIPLQIRQVLEGRLSGLSGTAEKALGVLSVYDDPAYPGEVAKLAGIPEEPCVSALEELEAKRLLTWSERGVSLPHALVRQTVYERLSSTRRSWLHGRVAEHLMAAEEPASPGELALHFHRAGRRQDALRFALAAADQAESSGAVAEALRFLSIARENADEDEAEVDVLGRLANLRYMHRDLAEASALLELAAERFFAQGRVSEALLAQVRRLDALASQIDLSTDDVVADLRRVGAKAELGGHFAVMASAMEAEAQVLHRANDVKRIRSLLTEAERQLGRGDTVADCRLNCLLGFHTFYGSPSKALQSARTAVREAGKAGLEHELLLGFGRLLMGLLVTGRLGLEEGKQVLGQVAGLAERSGDLALRFKTKANTAVWYLDTGELDRAEAALADAESVVRGTPEKGFWATLHYNLGELQLRRHCFDEARSHYQALRGLLGPGTPEYHGLAALAGYGLCQLQTGNIREARVSEEELERRLAGFELWTHDPWVILKFRAEMSRRRGDRIKAAQMLDEGAHRMRDRFVLSWIKLVLEKSKLAGGGSGVVAELNEARELCESLRLAKRMRELEEALRRLATPGNWNRGLP